MSKYKVTLKPLDCFFFGGEQTFDNGDSQSFIVRSNRMPQQTTILGMVRYQLLKQNNLLLSGEKEIDEARKQEREKLIGKESFDIEANEVQSFGKIKSISPVFIQKGTHQLLPMALTYGIDVCFDDSKVWMSGKQYAQVINAPSFEEKEYNNFCKLIDEENKSYEMEGDNGLFTSSMRIGITKAESGDENKKGFFKQETLRFRDSDTSFAFYLELEDEIKLDEDIVFIGAEQSCFKMEINDCDCCFVPNHPAGSILLLSPTYINSRIELDEHSIMYWCGTTGFRNLRQSEGGKLKSGIISYHRHSSLCTFLTAGSVIFYGDDKQKNNLEKMLKKQNLQNIGYNHYSIK